MNAVPAVAAESLTVVRGDKEVLHGLSFTVPRGGITGLLGPLSAATLRRRTA